MKGSLSVLRLVSMNTSRSISQGARCYDLTITCSCVNKLERNHNFKMLEVPCNTA